MNDVYEYVPRKVYAKQFTGDAGDIIDWSRSIQYGEVWVVTEQDAELDPVWYRDRVGQVYPTESSANPFLKGDYLVVEDDPRYPGWKRFVGLFSPDEFNEMFRSSR